MLLIIAKDPEERRRALEGALKGSKPPYIFFDSEQFNLFLQEVETLPFLSSTKPVVLQEVDLLGGEALDRLCAYVEKPSRWISLYLTAASLPPQSKLLKKIEKVIRIKEEKPWERDRRLAEWVVEEGGGRISLSVAQAFVKGVDSQYLQQELEKLICYAGESREITLDALRSLSTPLHHETLWQLGDALFAKQTPLALQIGRRLFEEEGSLLSLLAHLRTQYHTLLKILTLFGQGGALAVSQAFPYLKGGLLEKKIKDAQNYGSAQLEQGLIHLFETELKAKSSGGPPLLLLEMLLVKLTNDSYSTTQCARSR